MSRMNVAILGLGRFGSQLALELKGRGVDVLAVDRAPDRVLAIAADVAQASDGNLTDPEFLKSLDLRRYDSVVVAIGSDVATSVLVTLTLSNMSLKNVVAKASTVEHARALGLAGANRIVNPEKEAAERLAHTLGSRDIEDYMPLKNVPEGVARVQAPQLAIGRAIGKIDVSGEFNVILLGRLRGKSLTTRLDLEETVQRDDFWIVIGDDEALHALRQ